MLFRQSIIWISLTFFLCSIAWGIHDNEDTERYQALISQYRCIVCQNQPLMESDNSVSRSMKDKIQWMVKEGYSDQQIDEYLRERYGDFISYRPQLNSTTWVLWLFPLVLLLFMIRFLSRNVRL